MNQPMDDVLFSVVDSEKCFPYESEFSQRADNREFQDLAAALEDLSGLVDGHVVAQGMRFLNMCNELGVFRSISGCDVDLLDNGDVMFDWNEGARPVFTVVVRKDKQIVYSGRYKNGDLSGTDTEVRSLKAPLERLMEEGGRRPWATIVSQDSLTSGEGEATTSKVVLSCTPQQTMASYLFSRQQMQPATI